MLVLVLLLLLGCTQAVAPAAQLEATVSNQDVAVFRAILEEGLIPPPDVGDPLDIRADTRLLPTVSRTLRMCRTTDPTHAVFCIPEAAISSIATRTTAAEVSSLKNRNTEARAIPADQLVVITAEQVFRGSSTWSAVWSQSYAEPLPDCVMYSTPVSDAGEAAVYAVRLWQNRAYGWYVRLQREGSRWRVYGKQLVWRSHPAV